MSCKIIYNNQNYTIESFKDYLVKNKNLFLQDFISQDIEGFKEFVNKSTFDKELAQKIQDKLQRLYPEIKLNITNNPVWENGNNVFNQEEFNNQIQYRLKAVQKVLDNLTKIKQWESNKSIDNSTLWKKIGELGIPNQQLELLKNSKGNTVEEKLLDFVNQYSYTVEINTATKDKNVEEGFESIDNRPVPTTYYSNLTVPGGTNYTENEIATPAITPSIKGHAQFATDNGIGWFRSDDKHPFTGFLEDLIASGTIKKVRCG